MSTFSALRTKHPKVYCANLGPRSVLLVPARRGTPGVRMIRAARPRKQTILTSAASPRPLAKGAFLQNSLRERMGR